MKLSSLQWNFDAATLARLFRKQSIGSMIMATKATLSLGCFILLVLIIYEIISSYLTGNESLQGIERSILDAKSKISEQHSSTDDNVDITIIRERNIFGPLNVPTPASQAAPKATKSTLLLIGTFLTDKEPPYAIIEDEKKKTQDVFGLGDEIFGEAKVLTIRADQVEIERNGERELLTIEDTPTKGGEFHGGIASVGGDRFLVEEGEIDKALENLPMLLTQARAVPYFRDGKAVGLRLFAIKTGSLYEKLGLKNGDILKGINGNDLTDLSQAMQLFEKLKTERSINVNLERNAEEKQFGYEIK